MKKKMKIKRFIETGFLSHKRGVLSVIDNENINGGT